MKLPSILRPWSPPPDPNPPEERQSAPFTDAIVAQILRNAQKTVVNPAATAAVETAAGIVARAFAVASVEGAEVSPSTLSFIARELVVRGECVLYNEGTAGGASALVPVSSYDVRGASPLPERWMYRVEITTPGGVVIAHDPAIRSRVFHALYSFDPVRPWVGIGPLQRAIRTGEFASEVERSLLSEMNCQTGYLLSTPLDPSDPTMLKFKQDLADMDGDVTLVQGTDINWATGSPNAPGANRGFAASRIGPDPSPVMVELYRAVQTAVLGVCGVPAELVLQSLEGTGQREAWRRCLHGTIQPLGRLVGHALSATLMRPVSLSFDAIFASDIQGRARSFQSMVAAGMDVAKAAALSGLMASED